MHLHRPFEADPQAIIDHMRAERTDATLGRLVSAGFARRFVASTAPGGWRTCTKRIFNEASTPERAALSFLVVDDVLEYVDEGQSISVRVK